MTISFSGSCTKTISSVTIDSDGNLIVIYSDNTSENLGKVVGADGKNFAPDQIGNIVPGDNDFVTEAIGFVYESLANGTSVLYFKNSAPGITPVVWSIAPYGKGDKGDPFMIDGTGTTLPDINSVSYGYTFLNTDTGAIYIKGTTLTWGGPYQFKGDRGPQGQFIVNSTGTTLPDATTLYEGYTFLNSDTGMLYYVYKNGSNVLTWSTGVLFRGPQGIQGIQGETGSALYTISNTVTSFLANTLIPLGTVTAGYVVTNIDVNVTGALNVVSTMEVRFGGTVQSSTGSVVIAPDTYFDVNNVLRFIVNETNHEPSTSDQLVSAIFDYSANNSTITGEIKYIITIAKALPVAPIII